MATMILRDTHRALEQKMKELEKQKKETSIKIREAASHGDLKENGEYHAAREEQSFIVRKTQTLQTHSPFKIVEYSEIETDEVGFGNKVSIYDEVKEETKEYYLLGPIEFELDTFPMVVTSERKSALVNCFFSTFSPKFSSATQLSVLQTKICPSDDPCTTGPVAPVAPVAPSWPVGPVAPVGPCIP